MITPEELRQAREAAGLSQAEAAEMVYRKRDTWQKWESGRLALDPACAEFFILKLQLRKMADSTK
ncbi:MAG: helix-turn-helix transcriptional regulator [Trichlorobacter sp.]|nr:helix-turn-helix transcriptional regulator [Trichlorobacter sp.]